MCGPVQSPAANIFGHFKIENCIWWSGFSVFYAAFLGAGLPAEGGGDSRTHPVARRLVKLICVEF